MVSSLRNACIKIPIRRHEKGFFHVCFYAWKHYDIAKKRRNKKKNGTIGEIVVIPIDSRVTRTETADGFNICL